MKIKTSICLIICVGIILSGALKSFAAENQASQSPSHLSFEQITTLRGSLESSQDIPDEIKKSAFGMLEQAKSFHELAVSYSGQAVDVDASVKAGPARIKQIKAVLELTPPAAQEALLRAGASGMTIESVEQELRQAQNDFSDAQAAYSSWRDKQSQHALLAQKLRDSRSQANQRLDEIRLASAADSAPDADAVMGRIKRLLLLAEQHKCRAELSLSEKQLVGYDVLGALDVSERDFAARDVTIKQGIVAAWRNFAQNMRAQAAVQAREDAIRAMMEKAERLPVLKAEYDANIELGRQRESIIKDDAKITLQFQKHTARLAALEDVFKLAREWLDQGILSESVSLIIHEQGNSLPSMFMFRRRVKQRQEKLIQIRDERMLIDRKKRDLANPDEAVGAVLGSLPPVPAFEEDVLRQEIRTLLYDRREILNKQDEAYRRLFKTINTFAFTDQQLMQRADEFKLFLAQNLLWIRSDKPIGSRDISYLNEALAWMFSPQNWQGVYRDFSSALREAPFLWAFCLIMCGCMFAVRRWARGELKRTVHLVNTFETDSFTLTVWACAATVVLAVSWPFLLYAPARILADMPDVESFTRSVCAGVKRVAVVLAMYSFIYYVCHKDGLAAVHCRWSEVSRAVIKKNLAWFLAVFGPFVFFFIITEVENNEHYEASLGRFSFIILMLLMTVLFARVFDLRNGIAAVKLQHSPGSWLSRLRYLWYGTAVGVPLVFAGLAFNGYFYTALMLMRRMYFSIWVLFIAVLLYDVVLRWLLLARRRLALERNKEKSSEKEATNRIENDSTNTSDCNDEGGSINVHDKQVDLVQIDEQTRGLLRIIIFFSTVACLWAIWAQILPALDLLNDISVWSYRETIDGVTQMVPMSLGSLVWAIVFVVVAFVAARNLPGVLNITLFSRLTIDEGAKYALVTICRYVVVVIGILVVVNFIGFRWESLQWLIAALGVGLGFGLQEIVANFICGLIILFERPFRLGDVVTSGDVTGKVSRIQIRATTITDWDRHELIVPNKEFITGRLINWTLSDPIIRVIVTVGVKYGSDTLLVEQLLKKVAVEAEIVLDEPEPRALFVGFGDSSLNFELRVFISGVNTLTTKHQLHMAIDREFRKAGITISFPQRDVHFDSLGPLDVRVMPEKGPENEKTD